MPGLYPNPSAAAENFKVGDQVKWFVSEQSISPYIGVVTQICPSINKVWVEFPIGGNQQKDPTELILVPPLVGKATVTEDTGYSDYSKKVSEKDYGTVNSEDTLRMAKKILPKKAKEASESNSYANMSSKIASDFASQVVEKLAADVLSQAEKGATDIQAYQALYPQYENICSDSFMRTAISKIYGSCNGKRT